jgi:Mor family transcriptional regulator
MPQKRPYNPPALSPEEIANIVGDRINGDSVRVLAKRYHHNFSTICAILRHPSTPSFQIGVEEAAEIRMEYTRGASIRELGARYHHALETISELVRAQMPTDAAKRGVEPQHNGTLTYHDYCHNLLHPASEEI